VPVQTEHTLTNILTKLFFDFSFTFYQKDSTTNLSLFWDFSFIWIWWYTPKICLHV